jgi:hypothetical protein
MEIRPRWLHPAWVLKLRYAADFEVEPLSCMTVAVVCRPCCMFLFTSSFFFLAIGHWIVQDYLDLSLLLYAPP